MQHPPRICASVGRASATDASPVDEATVAKRQFVDEWARCSRGAYRAAARGPSSHYYHHSMPRCPAVYLIPDLPFLIVSGVRSIVIIVITVSFLVGETSANKRVHQFWWRYYGDILLLPQLRWLSFIIILSAWICLAFIIICTVVLSRTYVHTHPTTSRCYAFLFTLGDATTKPSLRAFQVLQEKSKSLIVIFDPRQRLWSILSSESDVRRDYHRLFVFHDAISFFLTIL